MQTNTNDRVMEEIWASAEAVPDGAPETGTGDWKRDLDNEIAADRRRAEAEAKAAWDESPYPAVPEIRWNATPEERSNNRSRAMRRALTDDPYVLFPKESVGSLAVLSGESPEQMWRTDHLAMKYASAQYFSNLYRIPFDQAVSSFEKISEMYFGEKQNNAQSVYLKLRDQVKAQEMPGWWGRRGYDAVIGGTSGAKRITDMTNVFLVRPLAEMNGILNRSFYGGLELAARGLGFRTAADWLKAQADRKRNPVHSLADSLERYSRSRDENIRVLSEWKGEDGGFTGQVVGGVIQNLPELFLTIGFAGVKAGCFAANSLYYGAGSLASELEETRYDENMNAWRWVGNAVAVGSAEMIFEQLSGVGRIAGKWWGKLSGDEVKRLSDGFGRITLRTLRSIGSDAAGEGVEEILTGITQRFSNLLFHKEGRDLARMSREEIFHELCDPVPVEGSVGGFLGGTMGGVGFRERQRMFRNQAEYQNFRADVIGAAKEQLAQLRAKEQLTDSESRLAERLETAIEEQNIEQPGGVLDIGRDLVLEELRAGQEAEAETGTVDDADDELTEFEYGKKLEEEGKRGLNLLREEQLAAENRDAEAVRRIFQETKSRFRSDLDIELTDSFSLPEPLRKLVEQRPGAEGLWADGKIYLLEDRLAPGRVRKVFLHEAVAHEGLRRVFGNEFDRFLGKIVNDHAEGVARTANRLGLDVTTPEGQLEAADEFLAETAERVLNADNPDAGGDGVFRRIVNAVREWLRNHGFDLAYSDREIAELLRASARNLLTRTERAVRAEESGSGIRFAVDGDERSFSGIYEKADPNEKEVIDAYIYTMTGSPVARLSGEEFQKDNIPITEKVTAYFNEKYHGSVMHPELGEVKLDREGVKDSLGHGIGRIKAAAYSAVPQIIEKGKICDRQKNWKDRGYDTTVVVAPLEIAGEPYIGEVVIQTRPNRQGLYLHEVELKKKLDNAFKTPTEGSAFPASRLILSQLLEKIKRKYKAGNEKNTRFSIIGERGAGSSADSERLLRNLSSAREMERRGGYDAGYIKFVTGWERGKDGKWRTENSDDWRFRPEVLNGEYDEIQTLGDAIDAPELFSLYPELRDCSLAFLPAREMKGASGYFDRAGEEIAVSEDLTPDEIRSTLIHEIQHWIQEKEGFARGGNLSDADDAAADTPSPQGATEDKPRAEMVDVPVPGAEVSAVYRRFAGEVEARNAEFRAELPLEQRLVQLLKETEDVAEEDKIYLEKILREERQLSQPEKAYYEIPFREGLARVIDPEQNENRFPVFVSETPEVLRKIGFTALPMMMNARHLRLNYYTAEEFKRFYGAKDSREHAHGLHRALEYLPKALETPLAVVVNRTPNAKPGSVVVITDMNVNGKKVVVPVLIESENNVESGRIDSHLVLTVYDSADWVNTFLKPALEAEKQGVGIFYLDDKKANRYSALSKKEGSIPAGFVHNINDEGSPVKGIFKKQTETLQFREWFGGSKVVDESGKPLTVYHGTEQGVPVFDMKGGTAWFSRDRNYAEERGGKRIAEVYLRIRNPLYAKLPPGKEADPSFERPLIERAKREGRDGLILQMDTENGQEAETFYAVFSANQIKSATENTGSFDRNNPDIRYSLAVPSKAGFAVERVNENAGREFNDAKGVIVQPEQIYKRGEVPEEQPRTWLRKRCVEYARSHHILGEHETPALGDGVKVSVGSVKAVLYHPGSDIKNNLIAAIPDMLKDAVLIQVEDNGRNKSYLLASKVRYGEDERFIAGMIVHESQGKFYYDHELVEIEDADIQNGLPLSTLGTGSESASVITIIQDALFASGFDKKDNRNIRFAGGLSSELSEDPVVKAKVEAISKILYRHTGTLNVIEPEEAASILEKGGWNVDPVSDEAVLIRAAAEAMHMKREHMKQQRAARERSAIKRADDWTGWMIERYGDGFRINPGPKYDETVREAPFTGSWIDRRKTERGRSGSIPAEEAAKYLTEKSGKEVTADMVVSHFADLKKEALLENYRAKRRKKNELYEIERQLEEEEILESGGDPLFSAPPEESEQQRILREKYQREKAKAEQAEIDRWLYENVEEWRWVSDAMGGLNLRHGFVLRPAHRFTGEPFTGAFISPAWRRYSEERPGKRTGKALADYLAVREKELRNATGKHSDELAKEIAAKTGGDELEIEQRIVDFFRDLKRGDLRNSYREAKRSEREHEQQENREADRVMGAEAETEHFKNLLKLMENDRVNIIQIQQSAAAYARRNLPEEMRGAFLDRVAALSKYKSDPSPKYPEGRRKYELEKLLSDMQTYRIRDRIRNLLDSTRVRVKNGRPVQPLGENRETVDEIRKIVQTPAYDVENKIAFLKEKQNEALCHVDENGNPAPQQAKADDFASRILLWDLFGRLELRTKEQNLEALNLLRNLIKNDRTGLLQKLYARKKELEVSRFRAKQEITGSLNPRIGRRVEEPKLQPWKYTLMNNSLRTVMELVTSRSGKAFDDTVFGGLYGKVESATQKGTTLDRESSERSLKEIESIFQLDTLLKRGSFWKEAERVVEKTGIIVTKFEHWRSEGAAGVISDYRVPDKGYISVKNARKLLKNVAEGKARLPELSAEFLRQQLSDFDLGIERTYDIFHNPDEDEAFRSFAEKGRISETRRRNVSRDVLEEETDLVILKTHGEEAVSQRELSISKAEGANILMQWEQPDVRARMRWNGWSDESIEQLKRFIGPDFVRMAYWMRSEIAKTGALVDAEARELYGCGLPRLENYFPTSYNETIGKQMKSDPLLGDQFGDMTVNPTFLIARKFHLSDIDIHRSIFQAYFRHQAEAHHFLAYGRVIRELRGIVNDREVGAAIRSRFGTNAYNALVDRIDLIANAGRKKCEAAEWMGNLFRYWTPAKIAINSSSVLKQLAGSVAYVNEIPAAEFIRGVAESVSGTGDFKRFYEFAKNSDYFKNRFYGGVNSEVMYLMRSTRSGKIEDSFGNALIDKGTYLTRWADGISTLRAGYSVFRYHYRKALESGRNHEQAWDIAAGKWMRATDETQQSGYLKDQNYFQSSAVYYKYFTAFLSNPIQIMNLELMQLNNIRYGSGKRKEEAKRILMKQILVNHVVVPTLMVGITQFLKSGFDPEEYKWEDFLTAFLLGPFEGAFIAGKAFAAVAGEISAMARHERRFGNATFNAFPQLDDALKSIPKLVRIFEKDNPDAMDYFNAIQGGADLIAAGGAAHIPLAGAAGGMLSGAMREVKRWYRLLMDEDNSR